MKIQIALSLLLTGLSCICSAQTIPPYTAPFPENIEWNNYSTSYIDEKSDSVPVLVAAIPYDGIYSMGDRSALDMDYSGSAFRFRSNLKDRYRKMITYSPEDVYFFVPGIFKSNASLYEYRVLVNDSIALKPWSGIDQFTGAGFGLADFRKEFAFLGGYKTSWGHYITVELRKKGASNLTAASVVYWKQTKPQLINILTADELTDMILKNKKTFDRSFSPVRSKKWQERYPASEIDPETQLPKTLKLSPKENSLIFFLGADIYQKEALEYHLIRNEDQEYRKWGANDYDNNMISLRDLSPGRYKLEMRYRNQPNNITSYTFEIKPAWYQTSLFRLLFILLLSGCIFSFVLLLKLKKQQRKIKTEQDNKERYRLNLKMVRAQLNPHFVFNALSSIQGLVNNQDIAGTNRYLSDFGMLVRNFLADSSKEFIALEKEISTIDLYLQLEQLRFKFIYRIDLDAQLEPGSINVPSFLLQPLVENAVKHGISGKKENGVIRVEVRKEAEDLHIRITDNGKGFDPAETHTGYGLSLTRERIDLLNELAEYGSIEMQIGKNGISGTVVHLTFKNWLE